MDQIEKLKTGLEQLISKNMKMKGENDGKRKENYK